MFLAMFLPFENGSWVQLQFDYRSDKGLEGVMLQGYERLHVSVDHVVPSVAILGHCRPLKEVLQGRHVRELDELGEVYRNIPGGI